FHNTAANSVFVPLKSNTLNAFTANTWIWNYDGGHSAPHSFPTRRSSDLTAIGLQQTTTGGTYTFNNLPVGQTYKVCVVTPSGGRDRESTRPKSRHVAASYAGYSMDD